MHRKSFTLLELLAAITVMVLVAGMLTVALASANADAKITRTKGQIQKLNQILLTRYEEEAFRRLPVEFDRAVPTGFKFRTAKAAAEFRLGTLRDYLRIVMPDRRTDVLMPAAKIYAPLTSSTGAFANPDIFSRTTKTTTDPNSVPETVRRRYLTRLMTLTGVAPADPENAASVSSLNTKWTMENESSECLYLILATTVIDGVPVIEDFRAKDIRDTDGDGVPELLDAWETPIRWLRWPCGFWETYSLRDENDNTVRPQKLSDLRSVLGYDTIDYLHADFGPSGSTYGLLPIAVSAGPDREFDMLFSPDYSMNTTPLLTNTPMSYATMTWPTKLGTYPDPFCRYYKNDVYGTNYQKYPQVAALVDQYRAGMPGAYFDEPPAGSTTGDFEDQSTDNIFSSRP